MSSLHVIAEPQLKTDPVPVRKATSSVYHPEESGTEWLVTAAIFLTSVAYLLLFRRFTTMEPDEGIVLQGAQRILGGQVLYRDFFSFLTPGSFYLHVLLFKIFGSSFTVARTALAITGGIFAALTYLLSRRVCSRGIAVLAVALMTLSTLPYRFLVLHNWDSTLLACVAVYCAVRLVEHPAPAWAFALGSLVSLTVLFEQSKGAGLAVGVCLGFGSLGLVQGAKFPVKQSAWKWMAAGSAWPFLVTFGYFFRQHAVGIMLRDWFWPLQHYSAANRVAYGYANWSDSARQMLFETGPLWLRAVKAVVISPYFLVPLFPLIAAGLFLYWARPSIVSGVGKDKQSYYLVVTGALCGLLLSVVVGRADIIHFMYLQPLFALVLAWILQGNEIPGLTFRRLHPAISFILVASFLLFSVPLLLRVRATQFSTMTLRGEVAMPAADTVLEYLHHHVAPGGSVLVYPYLPLYNYLSGTVSPVGLDFFQPGMNTAVQRESMLRELRSGRVQNVLFEPAFAEKIPTSWPGTPLDAVVTDPIADYVLSHYRTCKVLRSPEWTFLFMAPKRQSCPAEGAP